MESEREFDSAAWGGKSQVEVIRMALNEIKAARTLPYNCQEQRDAFIAIREKYSALTRAPVNEEVNWIGKNLMYSVIEWMNCSETSLWERMLMCIERTELRLQRVVGA